MKPLKNRLQIFKVNNNEKHQSGGKSGSFFFQTENRRYIIKTMSQSEKDILLKTLPDMVKYLIDVGSNSIISRNYGVFKIKCKGMNSIYIMLMQNNKRPNMHLDNLDLMNNHRYMNQIITTFDLKGSKFGKQVIPNKELEERLKKLKEAKDSIRASSSNPLDKVMKDLSKSHFSSTFQKE